MRFLDKKDHKKLLLPVINNEIARLPSNFKYI